MKTEPIHPIRNVRYLRPQKEWKEIIAIYLYLAGWGPVPMSSVPSSTGSLILPECYRSGVCLSTSGKPPFYGVPILVAIGAPFLILDLGIKRRFLYACLNPRTSWVARGFLILSVFIVFGLVLLAKSVLPFKWLHPESAFWPSPEVIAIAFAFGTALYTGILLKATKSIPLWNTYLLTPSLSGVSTLHRINGHHPFHSGNRPFSHGAEH